MVVQFISLIFTVRKLLVKQLTFNLCQVSQVTVKTVNPRPSLPTEREEGLYELFTAGSHAMSCV